MANIMDISQAGIDLIKQFEGCVLHAYKDAVGKWTIGIGHLIVPGDGFTPDSKIMQVEADILLHNDLKPRIKDLNEMLITQVTQNQFDALLSLGYNIGMSALRKSTLIKKVNANDFDGAAMEFQKWTKAGGTILPGLVRRRQAEKQLFIGAQ